MASRCRPSAPPSPASNANQAKGFVEQGDTRWQIGANDQALTAREYLPLIISYTNGAPVRLRDVRQCGRLDRECPQRPAVFNGKPGVIIQVTRQPGANIIETVDRIKSELPVLRASIPNSIKVEVSADRSVTIRTSLHEVEFMLALSVVLVTLVVFLFLRSARATLIPAVAVPVSLIGTFAVMYVAGSASTISP